MVLPNLYGSIVTGVCAGITGGVGLTPAANVGDDYIVFEQATRNIGNDIKGKGIANPIAILFSCVQSGLQSTLVVTTDSPRPKLLKEFKSTIITSAFWINESMIIAGSTEGELFCCSISTENYFGGSLNHSVSLLYSIPGKDSLTGPDSYFS